MAWMVQMTHGIATGRNAGGVIRKISVSLLGTAALAAGLIFLRGIGRPEPETVTVDEVPPGETVPGQISLERLRELGL